VRSTVLCGGLGQHCNTLLCFPLAVHMLEVLLLLLLLLLQLLLLSTKCT
jgi:hypothetical protein